MEDDPDKPPPRPESLLPYDDWTEDALRQVVVRALAFVGANGLPGEHHFYVSFRTDRPGVVVPTRLLAQYPHEMTIVLQHQFWDLAVDEAAGLFSVGLSFGGVPTTLRVPFAALVAFADPYAQVGFRFRAQEDEPANDEAASAPGEAEAPAAEEAPEAPAETPQVVSLDAFRRRKD
ncbi:MAG: hypothetical protein JO157_14425 [Acetobacteraceae bacterium]|nr:hypothetical protein [Acetobacteraceae bacterium]